MEGMKRRGIRCGLAGVCVHVLAEWVGGGCWQESEACMAGMQRRGVRCGHGAGHMGSCAWAHALMGAPSGALPLPLLLWPLPDLLIMCCRCHCCCLLLPPAGCQASATASSPRITAISAWSCCSGQKAEGLLWGGGGWCVVCGGVGLSGGQHQRSLLQRRGLGAVWGVGGSLQGCIGPEAAEPRAMLKHAETIPSGGHS